MLTLPPRRVTHEHEAAHAVITRASSGKVEYISVKIQHTATGGSLGHAKWNPKPGDSNALVFGFVAGPAQTQITVEREGLDQGFADQSVELESRDLAKVLSQGSGDPPNVPGARYVVTNAMPAVDQYLRQPEVQAVVQTIADALEKAEKAGQDRVKWSDLEKLVDWSVLPPVPKLST